MLEFMWPFEVSVKSGMNETVQLTDGWKTCRVIIREVIARRSQPGHTFLELVNSIHWYKFLRIYLFRRTPDHSHILLLILYLRHIIPETTQSAFMLLFMQVPQPNSKITILGLLVLPLLNHVTTWYLPLKSKRFVSYSLTDLISDTKICETTMNSIVRHTVRLIVLRRPS